jgi:hypothetical protein
MECQDIGFVISPLVYSCTPTSPNARMTVASEWADTQGTIGDACSKKHITIQVEPDSLQATAFVDMVPPLCVNNDETLTAQ